MLADGLSPTRLDCIVEPPLCCVGAAAKLNLVVKTESGGFNGKHVGSIEKCETPKVLPLLGLGASVLGWAAGSANLQFFAPAQGANSGQAPTELAPRTQNEGANDDRDAIMKSARAFTDAFNKGDARAIAAMWTENGEFREPNGMTLVGRPAIEKAYTEFFKANPGAKTEVLIKSVRFPSKNLAVGEGLLRSSHGPKSLPASTTYVAVHVREGDQWKIALSSEAAPGRIGSRIWIGSLASGLASSKTKSSSSPSNATPKTSYPGDYSRSRLGKKPATARFASHSIRKRARFAPGHLKTTEHSQSLWFCDARAGPRHPGVLANGTTTAERIYCRRRA